MSAPRLLFLCLGNICRSPLVEAVARQRMAEAGLDVEVASRGTGNWHAGNPADARMCEVAHVAGIDLSPHRARQLSRADGNHFDLVFAMDEDNLREGQAIVDAVRRDNVVLYLPWAGVSEPREFPDPYYGGLESFTRCVALAERSVQGLIERLKRDGLV
ncbi:MULTISPECIES: low molecular weight protein-tyrosine-phosphatase [Dyella]|uniref:protein-tyrosine-phosphatase n=2 Tax=Dyella TaxID=231454 RepID=A0A4R0YTX5_9GAMM|nr:MULTISPECIES: low molecular weight protein-tyrosine-phosphatase [Dyella]TBR39562.1 low molecular weight phosphotyrosine protein phosphatase [Dyella terrae]TCI12855.1 low molecular weight phosphotyrosine protein phosphatase [Dyella soli]